MDTPQQPDSTWQPPAAPTQPQAWQELLHHMQELHARLEYLRLMLKLDAKTR